MPLDLWGILANLLVMLSLALALGALFERFRQSAILGFLLAGTLMGPGGFNAVSNPAVVDTMAELGVALLLFVIGLEFSWRRLVHIGAVGLGGGTVQVALTTLLGAGVARLAGQEWPAAFAIGAMGALSSTACVLRVLGDRSALDSIYGRASLGILLLQDLAVVPLVLLISMAAGGSGGEDVNVWREMEWAVLVIAGMLGAFYLLSHYLIPRLLTSNAARRNRELLILLAAVLALGSAWGSHWLGLSPALGAFLAGIMLAESPFALQLRADIGSLRTLFATLFFVSIGMYGEPRWITDNAGTVAVAVLLLVAGKFAITTLIMRCFALNWRTATATGLCLAQVGEFSFVLAQVASGGGGGPRLIDEDTFRLLVSATLVSMFLTPFLVAAAPHVGLWVLSRFSRSGVDGGDGEGEDAERTRGVILVGFGPAGRMVSEALRHGGHRPVTVLDSNPRNFSLASAQGFRAYLGDATSAEVWRHLRAKDARVIVVTVPDHRTATNIVLQAHTQAPGVPIVARSRYHAFTGELTKAGASSVVDEEELVGRRLGREASNVLRNKLNSTVTPPA